MWFRVKPRVLSVETTHGLKANHAYFYKINRISFCYATHTQAIRAIGAVVRADVTAIEDQVTRLRTVRRTAPIVTVRARVVERTASVGAIARRGQEKKRFFLKSKQVIAANIRRPVAVFVDSVTGPEFDTFFSLDFKVVEYQYYTKFATLFWVSQKKC